MANNNDNNDFFIEFDLNGVLDNYVNRKFTSAQNKISCITHNHISHNEDTATSYPNYQSIVL